MGGLPYKIEKMVNESNLLTNEIRRKKAEKTMTQIDYNITQDQIEELRNNGGLVLLDKLQLTERQLAAIMYTCSSVQVQLAFEMSARGAFASELEKCHKEHYVDSNSSDKPNHESNVTTHGSEPHQ